VELVWQYAETGERPTEFRVYRSGSPFTASSQATLIQGDHKEQRYKDTTVPDGPQYYGVVGLDEAGNVSALSNVVTIVYDGTEPSFGIVYDKIPPFGVGAVAITLRSTEKLFEPPTLTITPFGSGSPETLRVSGVDELTCSAVYQVTEGTPSGEAQVRVSGRDIAGNTFTGRPSGAGFVVDTQGPVGAVTTDVPEPVQVLAERDVQVTLSLSEPPQKNTSPILRFTPPEGGAVIVPLSGMGAAWAGTLRLRPDMGSGNGRFSMEVADELGNSGTGFSSGEYLEIYNTEFPEAPQAPLGLTALSKPGGAIDLSWSAAAKAESYRVYRSQGDCATAPHQLVADNVTGLTLRDVPAEDRSYCYGVSARRRGAESELSTPAGAVSDRVAPQPPVGVAVSLGTEGVLITWQTPGVGEAPDRYHVYRNGAKIGAATGALSAIDHPPLGGTHSYVVASVDAVGNESMSGAVAFDLRVGAVSALDVLVLHGDVPRITWKSSDPGTVGYNVYKGGIKLTPVPIPVPYFEDDSYAGSSRVIYEVRAVNASGDESPPRSVGVYPLALEALSNLDADGQPRPLVYNFFDSFDITVENRESAHAFALDQLQLRMNVGGVEYFALNKTVDWEISGGASLTERIVIPCGASYEDHILDVAAVQTDDGGNKVVYARDFVFTEVARGVGVIEMSTESLPLAGGYATIDLCIQNRGHADVDIVVNLENGSLPGDISVAVKNEAGLEISRGWYKGTPAESLAAANGSTYVRVKTGAALCVTVDVLVPEALEEGAVITFEGVVDKIYHHYGGDGQLMAGALRGSMESGITKSEYYGTAQADKDAYSNDEMIVITGQAVTRATGNPRPNAALKIGFYTRGFRWFRDVTADGEGKYRYEYSPTLGMSGHFVVWAAHPDVYDVIRHDEFDLYRMYCAPTSGDVRMSKADTLGFRVDLYNPGDTPLTGFGSTFRAYTVDGQGNEVDEPALSGQVNYAQDFVLAPGAKKSVDLRVTAAGDAPDAAAVEYTFMSSQGASTIFTGSVSLLPAVPIISVVSPSVGYVDISLNRGGMRSVPVTVTNKGLRDLLGVQLSLPAEITWMTLNLPRNAQGKVQLGDIPVGVSKTFDVVIAPPVDTEFGYHHDKIALKGTNSDQEFDINLYALVTSNLRGSVYFHVINILGQEVEGAAVRMRNAAIQEEIASVKTDEQGDALVPDLQEGDWSWQVVASGHYSMTGAVKVVADQVVTVEPLLMRSLVTINFSVVPVPFTDRYEIKIEQTFETHVPAPVLIVDPPFVEYKDIEPGFEAYFLVNVKNFGLVKAHDVTISSADSGYATLVPLISFVPELGAMQSIQVPYRYTYYGNAPYARKTGDMESMIASSFVGESGGALSPEGCFEGGYDSLAHGFNAIQSTIAAWGVCAAQAGAMVDLAAYLTVFGQVGTMALDLGQGAPQIAGELIAEVVHCIFGGGGGGGGGGWGGGGGGGPSGSFSGDVACFASGTPITAADGGRKPIEEIRVGDKVMAFDGKSDTVKRVYARESDHVREIWYRSEEGEVRRLETTDEHLLWIDGRDWVPARKVEIGDNLMSLGKRKWKVERNERFETPAAVYGFDVHTYRSYFAGGVLAHERCGVMEGDPAKEAAEGSRK
jgi:hypothetical protein